MAYFSVAIPPKPHYSKAEEKEARGFIPDPFGGDDACERFKHAIRVLRARIAWHRSKTLVPLVISLM